MSCNIVDTIATGDCEKLEKNFKCEQKLATVIATELVSEIVENALEVVESLQDTSGNNVGDIFENLSNKFQELAITEDKPKSPEIIEESPTSTLGVGDHIDSKKELGNVPSIRYPVLEKKSRLTDLVRNSKHLWNKLKTNERKDDARSCKFEKIIRVIDLDCKEEPFKVEHPDMASEEMPIARADSEEILNCCKENESLDEITLSKEHGEDYKKTMTFPLAGSSGKSFMEYYRTFKLTTDVKKKKWNFGSKIVNYIRKQQAKRQGKGVSEGIEISPQAEES